jgi:hypothetical protein
MKLTTQEWRASHSLAFRDITEFPPGELSRPSPYRAAMRPRSPRAI